MTPQANHSSINVLQFICPTGFYGAERWILALSNNSNDLPVEHFLAVTLEKESQELEIVKQFAENGGQVFEAPMAHRFDFSVVDQLVDYIKTNSIDVIHSHGYKSDILGVIAAKKAKIPIVVTPHGFENTNDLKLRMFIWLGCQAMKFADKVVPLSTELMKDVESYGIRAPQAVYIQNGVDLTEVDAIAKAEQQYSKAKKRIGFIGQMISRKNIDDILIIFDEIATKRDNVELVLLGDGDERVRLETLSQKLACNADIQFLGYRDDRLEYLKSFDLFVMTSTLEGIPRCLMEACAMGTPVAAYDIPGIDQLISDGKTGLLAKLGDRDGLKAKWLQILDDKSLANSLGENAKHFVNQHFSARRMAEEYFSLFKEITETRKRS